MYSEVQLKIRNIQQPSARFLSTQTILCDFTAAVYNVQLNYQQHTHFVSGHFTPHCYVLPNKGVPLSYGLHCV